jgi:uncharacterized protein (TIGR02284 family)
MKASSHRPDPVATEVGTGLAGGTYSAPSRSDTADSLRSDARNTVRASAGFSDLGGAGSADPAGQRGKDRSTAGSSAMASLSAAHSAWPGELGDEDDVVDGLNDLIECCRDGEYGFALCAEHAQSPQIKLRLSQHADEFRSAARELMDCIHRLGGKVDDGGSMMGSMHRGWVSVKGTLVGYSDRAMLAEAERGQDTALARYRKALDEKLPADVRSLVQRQAAEVQRRRDALKQWRDRLQARR